MTLNFSLHSQPNSHHFGATFIFDAKNSTFQSNLHKLGDTKEKHSKIVIIQEKAQLQLLYSDFSHFKFQLKLNIILLFKFKPPLTNFLFLFCAKISSNNRILTHIYEVNLNSTHLEFFYRFLE